MNPLAEMMQEITDEGADKIKCDANAKLNVSDGGGSMPGKMIKPRKRFVESPAPVGAIKGKNQAHQYQPTNP